MSGSLSVCPICTEFEMTPIGVKASKSLGLKYCCKKCGAEFWLKVTKKSNCKNFDKEENK